MDGAAIDCLEDSGIRIMVNRLGAELVSLRAADAGGALHGFLYRDGEIAAPASGWGNHATVMGYFLHRLLGEHSLYRGVALTGGTHGFLRHFLFDAPELRGSELIYRVDPARIPPGAYPLRVGLELSYSLTAGRLRVGFRFENQEPELDAHLSFGLHPGFAVTSPRTCKISLPAGHYVRHMAPGNFLDGKTESFDFAGGDFPFSRVGLPSSYILGLGAVPGRTFRLEDAGRVVSLDFSSVPYVTFWSDGGPFVCIEPCWGLPDSNPQKPFEEKVGIQKIAPGAVLEASFTIHPSFAPR